MTYPFFHGPEDNHATFKHEGTCRQNQRGHLPNVCHSVNGEGPGFSLGEQQLRGSFPKVERCNHFIIICRILLGAARAGPLCSTPRTMHNNIVTDCKILHLHPQLLLPVRLSAQQRVSNSSNNALITLLFCAPTVHMAAALV